MLSTILQAIDRADTRIDQWFAGSAPGGAAWSGDDVG
jgi:hypothetical protein